MPVVGWLRAGAAAAGVSLAMTAASGIASADDTPAPDTARSSTAAQRSGKSATRAAAESVAARSKPVARPASAERKSAAAPRAASAVSPGKSRRAAAPTAPVATQIAAPQATAAGTPSVPAASSIWHHHDDDMWGDESWDDEPWHDDDAVGGFGSDCGDSLSAYPAQVTAPVTVRAIVTDTLSWFGLDSLVPDVPVPDLPVPDFLAAAWVEVRRFHYTFFNSKPVLSQGLSTGNPKTGVVTGNVVGSDADGDALRYTASGASHGTVTIASDGTYTYTPTAELARTGGTDSFTVTVVEDSANPWHIHGLSELFGRSESDRPETVSLVVKVTVDAVNAAPRVSGIELSVPDADGVVVGSIAVTDTDGDPVTLSASATTKGAVVFDQAAKTFTYTPTAIARHEAAADNATSAQKTETFSLTVNDGTATTVVPVAVDIKPANALPVVDDAALAGPAVDGAITGTFPVTDPDGDATALTAISTPAKGTLEVDALARTFVYTPTATARHAAAADFALTADKVDTVDFALSDGHGATVIKSVIIDISPANTAPVVEAPTLSAPAADGTVTGTLVITDLELDDTTITLTTAPTKGVVDIDQVAKTFAYTPNPPVYSGGNFASGPTYNSVSMSYAANQTLSQKIVFDAPMQAAGGLFSFTVDAHAGGGRALQNDTGNLKLEFFRADNTLVTSAQTAFTANLTQMNAWSSAPGENTAPWTSLTLNYELSAADAANVSYVTVTMIGTDGSFWAGNYGPQWVMPTLTYNGGTTNILYNPEFGQTAQGWTASAGSGGSCGVNSGSAACVTNSGVAANAYGGGYSASGGTTAGQAGGYTGTQLAIPLLPTVNNGGTPPTPQTDSFVLTVSDGHSGATEVPVSLSI